MSDNVKMPYPTEEDGAMYWINVSREEYEQDSDNGCTEFGQCTDNVRTEYEQDPDSVRTLSVQRPDRNQTSVARAAKRPADTHYSVYKENMDIVKLLSNSKFIRENTSNTYRRIEDLPLSRAPLDLTEAVQRCGYPVSRNELAKIYTAANVCKRVPRWKVWTLCVFVAIVAVFLTSAAIKTINRHPSDNGEPTTLMASVAGTAATDFDEVIAEFERKNRFTFFPYRKGVMVKELGKADAKEYEAIMSRNMAAQIKATEKK